MRLEENRIFPEDYPFDAVHPEQLEDGTGVVIRPIRPGDASGLQAGFRSLSSESVYMRFLKAFRELSDEQARELATVDYHKRMAFVAEITEDSGPRLIGVARYGVVERDAPEVAESAIVVADAFQGRGLGTLLMGHLMNYARSQGIHTFLATALVSNHRIMNFIQRSGFESERQLIEPGVWEVRIHLDRKKNHHSLS